MQRRERLRIVDQHRDGAASHGVGDEDFAVDLGARQRRKQEAGLDRARISREAADVEFAVWRGERGREGAVHELS